jgi:hypothetical protein
MALRRKQKKLPSSTCFLSWLVVCTAGIYLFNLITLQKNYASSGSHLRDRINFISGAGGVSPPHRNFLIHPVTSQEDAALRASAASNVTAAVCHPTLFGNITLNRVLSFVSFYRLLGFGHIFFWYEEESLAWSPNDSLLGNLSYVTLIPNSQSQRNGYHGQAEVQRACRTDTQYGASYDWILVVDADEFLWLGPNTTTVQDFVLQSPQITYYSFGKWQYSTNRAISIAEEEDAGFGLNNLPFTLGRYCYSEPNSRSCPDWQGRSKVLSMPSRYPDDIPVHGSSHILASRDHEAVHYDHHMAHIKEWPGVAEAPHGQSIQQSDFTGKSFIVREPQTFMESKDVFLGVHWQAEAFPVLPNGTLLVIYDDQLSSWLQSVASTLRLAVGL